MVADMLLRWLLHSVSNKFSSSSSSKLLDDAADAGKLWSSPNNKISLSKVGDDDVHDHDKHYYDCKKVEQGKCGTCVFQMPLHYPRYKKADYEKMEEWKVDMLLQEYGICFKGTLEEKRSFAMGAFLWPDQL